MFLRLSYITIISSRESKKDTIIITLLPGRPKHKKVSAPKVVKPSLDTLSAQSNHVALIQGSRVKCARCLNNFSRDDASLPHFLSMSCSGLGSSIDRPIPMKQESIHIGKQTVHHTHSIHTFRGLIYCNNCGMRSSTKLHNLGKNVCPLQHMGWPLKRH